MQCEWLGLSFKVIVGSGCGRDCILEGNIGTALFFFWISFFPFSSSLCVVRVSFLFV